MDDTENETELLQTERFERLTVTAEKSILDENCQDVRGFLDSGHETIPCFGEGNSDSNEIVIDDNQDVENHIVTADRLMDDDINYIAHPAEKNSFASDDVAEILSPSAANGSESIAIECTEATSEQDASSFIVIDSLDEAVANTTGKKDFIPVNSNQYLVLDSSTELVDVTGLDASTSVVHAEDSSVSEHCSGDLSEVAELSFTGLLQPDSHAKGYVFII